MTTDLHEHAILNRPCAACGSQGKAVPRYRVNGCDIVQCGQCATGRAVPINNGFDPQRYYNEGYFNGGHADGYADYRGSRAILLEEFGRSARFIADRLSVARPRLLEIGCAYGYFLEAAAPHFDAHGVEIAAEPVADCLRRGIPNVHEGVLTADLAKAIGDIDALVLLDVIEHLEAPEDVLHLAIERLRSGGIVVMTTGDYGSLFARLCGKRWRLMTPPQHLWFFTAEGMRRLAARLGLVCESIDHPAKRVPLSLMAFQASRWVGGRFEAPQSWSQRAIWVNLFDAMRVVMRKPRS